MKLFAPLFAQHPGASTIPSLHSTCSQRACSALKKQRAPCSNYSVACENRYCHSAVGGGVASRFFIQVELCTLAIHFSACIYIYICFFHVFRWFVYMCVYFSLSHSPSLFLYLYYIYIYVYMHKHLYIHNDILCIYYYYYIYIISYEIYSLMCNILYIIFVICDLNTFLIHISNVVKYMAVFFNMCIF
jgi:hypothetical protein